MKINNDGQLVHEAYNIPYSKNTYLYIYTDINKVHFNWIYYLRYIMKLNLTHQYYGY